MEINHSLLLISERMLRHGFYDEYAELINMNPEDIEWAYTPRNLMLLYHVLVYEYEKTSELASQLR